MMRYDLNTLPYAVTGLEVLLKHRSFFELNPFTLT